MKKFIAVVVAACAALGLLAGCQSSANAGSATPITACVGSEPKSIDPAINQAVDGATYIIHTFEGLTKMNQKNEIVPGIAKSWKVSSDGLTYTFTLRDAKWSDGQPVKAQDFVYAWQRAVSPVTASAYAYQLYYIKNAQEINSQAVDKNGQPEKVKFDADGNPIQDKDGNYTADASGKYISANADGSPIWMNDLGVKATDDKTLVVTLAGPCSYFTQITAFPTLFPVRKDIVEKNPDKWATAPSTYIGDGPYTITSWEHNSKIVMKKNANYYDAKDIVANEIDWQLMDDDNSILAAYKNGQILLSESMPTEEIPALTKSKDATIYGNLGTYFYDLNVNKAPLNNVNVRKALSLAFDREYLVNQVSKGGEKPAASFVPIGIPDATAGSDFRNVGGNTFDPTTKGSQDNIKKAQQLLADAGFAGGKNFPTLELKYNTNSGHQAIAEYVQQEWKKNLGVNVTLVNEDWAVLQADRNNKNYEIARDGWLGDYVDPMTFIDVFNSKSGNNSTGWANKQYDALVQKAKGESSQADRMKDMHSAETILMNDMPIVPVYYYTDPDLVSPKLQGYVHSALGYKYLMWASVK